MTEYDINTKELMDIYFRLLRLCSVSYYRDNVSLIEDDAYDRILMTLRNLENSNPNLIDPLRNSRMIRPYH